MRLDTLPPPLPASRWMPALWLAALLSMLALAALWAAQALLVQTALAEGRAVADMAENVGRWASQYEGVHVRTEGVKGKLPGSFLTHSTFDTEPRPGGALRGQAVSAGVTSDRALMDRLETYYWKNPALVQREVADVVTASGSRIRWRMTARSVLNPSNQPTPFELEALDDLQSRAPGLGSTALPAVGEYWRLQRGQVLYARAIVAQSSCLACHDTAEKAPDFMKAHPQFNGGGSFGYRVGQPAGLISVTVPLAQDAAAIGRVIPPAAWAALVGALLATLALTATLLRRH